MLKKEHKYLQPLNLPKIKIGHPHQVGISAGRPLVAAVPTKIKEGPRAQKRAQISPTIKPPQN